MASTSLMGWTRSLLGLFVVSVALPAAFAQPKPVALEGATEGLKLTTASGFIDDAVGVETDRLVYVVSDSSSKAELHVVTLATKAETVADISAITLHPTAVHLIGPRAFVVGEVEGGKQVAALVELADKGKARPAGTAVYKVGAATHITYLPKKGIAVHRVTATATTTRHEIEMLSIENGRRLGAVHALDLDPGNLDKKLELRVNHWSDGWTRAYGIKGGEWDKKEDQRSPDTEATFDMIGGKLIDRQKIGDLFEQRKRFQVMADAAGKLDFVRFENQATLQIWRGGKLAKLELDQPLSNYDSKSLQFAVSGDTVWVALKVDPVNAEAVARKKADIEYFDIFKGAADGKAARKVRVPAAGFRHRFGVMADGKSFYLVERNQSMDRGGKSLTVYQLP